MVDLQTVCCMCGDVGFSDKLFRCKKCSNRFQHSYDHFLPPPPPPHHHHHHHHHHLHGRHIWYCSNYYSEFSEPIELCNWCRSEEERNNATHGSSSKKSVAGQDMGDKIKQQERSSAEKGNKNQSGVPSPRTTTRRYKLLKDVMY